ncbi:hypothetical protein, partial [Pseudoruegeria sp. SK021]|uniref:hypothetical protein n=1 Tax=Pseudoruegeria sp. SK021 TaxID=1933035 RepID=UPI000A2642DC
VESFRNEAGKPRLRVVANLGRVDGMKEGQLDALIRGLSRAAGPVFVKLVVRRFHAASLISGALNSFSGFSQTGPAGCQFRVFP